MELNMDNFHRGDKNFDLKSHENVSHGIVESNKYKDYYDVSHTITTAGSSNPNDFDSAVYNRERIYVDKGRNAERLLVINDGPDTLYLVVSHGGELNQSAEVPMYAGEIKIYYNVYELRLRSPTAGTAYRVMEYELNQNEAGLIKTIQTELLPITAVAANAQQISSEFALTKTSKATIFIDHARDVATAFVGAGTEYRVEVSEQASGNSTWRTAFSVVCDITAASSIVMDAEEAIGQTLIEIGATTPAVGDIVFFKNATLANSEWAKVVAINAGVTFTIQDGLTYTQPAITLFNKAEQFVLAIDTTSFTRLRVVVNNNNGTTNQNIVSRVAIITVV
jgi:hypothetical protein